ncbi:DUF4148 domain-containing protein [Caenimonas sedimenti]|uniref:DUF4148 domain-containing protein n=2 Tax=Caenimonas sedimenti TaxID=2596921 RepID=A0A562ZR68_9BURK|nr:DUF4148 domain-containing protein [Caenimonas sedimenti]
MERNLIMNRHIAAAFVVAAAAFAGSAFAETPTVVKDDFVSTASRAQVNAELVAFKQAGVNPWSTQYNPLRFVQGTRTRAQVVGEYLASRDQVAALTGEDSGSTWLAQAAPRNAFGDTLAGLPVSTR